MPSATRARRICASRWCASTSTSMASRSPAARPTSGAASRCIWATCWPRRGASSAGLTNLTWVTAGFGWVTIVAPILVAAPLYFTGKISFGGLMMAAAAFTQAQSSLRWFVDNFSAIADWRATLLRVASFRHALTTAAEAARLREPHQLRRRRRRHDHHRGSRDRFARRRRAAQGAQRRHAAPGSACSSSVRPAPARRSCSARWRACGLGLRPHHAAEG